MCFVTSLVGSGGKEDCVLHVYLDRESQHCLMSCMRMKTCMKMVAVSGYAGPLRTITFAITPRHLPRAMAAVFDKIFYKSTVACVSNSECHDS